MNCPQNNRTSVATIANGQPSTARKGRSICHARMLNSPRLMIWIRASDRKPWIVPPPKRKEKNRVNAAPVHNRRGGPQRSVTGKSRSDLVPNLARLPIASSLLASGKVFLRARGGAALGNNRCSHACGNNPSASQEHCVHPAANGRTANGAAAGGIRSSICGAAVGRVCSSPIGGVRSSVAAAGLSHGVSHGSGEIGTCCRARHEGGAGAGAFGPNNDFLRTNQPQFTLACNIQKDSAAFSDANLIVKPYISGCSDRRISDICRDKHIPNDFAQVTNWTRARKSNRASAPISQACQTCSRPRLRDRRRQHYYCYSSASDDFAHGHPLPLQISAFITRICKKLNKRPLCWARSPLPKAGTCMCGSLFEVLSGDLHQPISNCAKGRCVTLVNASEENQALAH